MKVALIWGIQSLETVFVSKVVGLYRLLVAAIILPVALLLALTFFLILIFLNVLILLLDRLDGSGEDTDAMN